MQQEAEAGAEGAPRIALGLYSSTRELGRATGLHPAGLMPPKTSYKQKVSWSNARGNVAVKAGTFARLYELGMLQGCFNKDLGTEQDGFKFMNGQRPRLTKTWTHCCDRVFASSRLAQVSVATSLQNVWTGVYMCTLSPAGGMTMIDDDFPAMNGQAAGPLLANGLAAGMQRPQPSDPFPELGAAAAGAASGSDQDMPTRQRQRK